jgi:hypothetical protein
MENFICNLSIGRYYSSIKCTALYSLTLALLCSILPVLLCLVLPCNNVYYFVLFCSALAFFSSTLLLSELWRRRNDRGCIILTQSQSQSMYHWSQTSLNQPKVSVIVSTTPMVPDQYHPPLTQSQSQSIYHWSQTSLKRPEVSVIVWYNSYHWSQTSIINPRSMEVILA